MKKLFFPLICAFCAIAIGLSTWALVRSYTPAPVSGDVEYTMYVGTNDKDTYQLEMTRDEARDIVHNTMMDHFSDGFTMYEANGVWRDDLGTITLEYTLVCILVNVDKNDVYKAADELIVALNQSTILIVSNTSSQVDFYTGQ